MPWIIPGSLAPRITLVRLPPRGKLIKVSIYLQKEQRKGLPLMLLRPLRPLRRLRIDLRQWPIIPAGQHLQPLR